VLSVITPVAELPSPVCPIPGPLSSPFTTRLTRLGSATDAVGLLGSTRAVVRPVAWFLGTVCDAGETTSSTPRMLSCPDASGVCAAATRDASSIPAAAIKAIAFLLASLVVGPSGVVMVRARDPSSQFVTL